MEVKDTFHIECLSKEWISYRLKVFNEFTRRSLEMQTNQDFVAIVGIHESTRYIIQDELKKYPRLPSNIIMTSDIQGEIERRIKGADYMYLIQLDSDDMYHPSFIEYLHHYHVNPNKSVVFANYGYMYNVNTQAMEEYYFSSSNFITQIFSVEEYMKSARYYYYILHAYMKRYPHEEIDKRMSMIILHDKNSWPKYAKVYPKLFEKPKDYTKTKQVLKNFGLEFKG